MKKNQPNKDAAKETGKPAVTNSKPPRFTVSLLFWVLFLLIIPLVYTAWVLDPVLIPRTTALALLLIPFFIFLAIANRKGEIDTSIVKSPFIWVYLGYVLLSGVSVILSVNTGEGLWQFLKTSLFFMIFLSFVLSLGKGSSNVRMFSYIFIGFSLIALSRGVYQLSEVFIEGSLNHQTSYRINSWFAHRNLYAQVLLFSLPFLGMGIYALKGWMRLVAGLLIAISLVMITLLLVKSVWLALAASTVLTLFLVFIFRKSLGLSGPFFRRIMIYLFGGLLVVMISIAVYSRFESIETFEKQTYVLKNYRFGSAIERIHLWEKSIDMFQESPVIGIGADNWRIYLPKYGTSDMRSAEGEIFYQRPHNDFLWVLSERGIITFAFYALLFLLSLFYQLKIISGSSSREAKVMALFLFFFLICYGVVAGLSFPMERPVHSILLNFVFAFTLVLHHQTRNNNHKSAADHFNYIITGCVLVSMVIGFIGIKKLNQEHHLKNALMYRINGQWEKVIDEIEYAESFFTRLDPTATPLKWYSGLSWYNLGEKDKALSDFQDAYKANPWHMHVLNNLATIYGAQGEYRKAIQLYREAVRISPDFTDAVINLSSSLFNIREVDSAYLVLRNARNIKDHMNYKKVLQAIVYRKVENLKTSVDDRDLEVTLTRIRNSNEWMMKVHEQSIFDQVPLEKQLIIESIYVLETVDKTIDSNRAEFLRGKYLKDY